MAKVLYITANPKSDEQSYCLSVGKAFVEAYQKENPQDEIIELDLYQLDIPDIDTDVFSGWGKLQQGKAFDELSEEEKGKVAKINQYTDQFVSADKYIFVTPMWNLSIPPRMRTYIDTICIAGRTFKYTAAGAVGLLTDKKAVHIQARGGIYSEGPAAELEMGDRYIRMILSFLGVPSIESIIVEGMAQMPEEAEAIKERAIVRAKEVAVDFAKDLVQTT